MKKSKNIKPSPTRDNRKVSTNLQTKRSQKLSDSFHKRKIPDLGCFVVFIIIIIISVFYLIIIVSNHKRQIEVERVYKTACAKYDNHDFKGAIADFNKVIELSSKIIPSEAFSPNPGLLRGKIRHPKSEKRLIDSYLKRANAKYILKDYKGALADFKNVNTSKNIETFKWLGIELLRLEEFSDAISAFDGSILSIKYYLNDKNIYNREIALAYFNRGIAKNLLRDYAGAIEDYTEVIKIDNRAVRAYFNRGNANYAFQNYLEATGNATNVIGFYPKCKEAYLLRGKAKYFIQDYNGALADFIKTIELDPNNSEAYYFRGLLKIKSGDNTNGCLDTIKARKLKFTKTNISILKDGQIGISNHAGENSSQWNSFDPIYYYNDIFNLPAYGEALVTKPDTNALIYPPKYGKALETKFDTIARQNFKRMLDTFTLGILDFHKENYKEAIEHFNNTMELDPKCATCYYYRGLSEILSGLKEDGCSDLKKAKELGVVWADAEIKKYCQ